MANQISIIGQLDPIISGVKFVYALENTDEIVPGSVRWEVKNGSKFIVPPTAGNVISLTFHKASAGRIYVLTAYYRTMSTPLTEESTMIFITPKMGPPSIVEVNWLDANYQKITSEQLMEYLEDVYLTIQTVNIPSGETVYIQIREKETTKDRNAGSSIPVQIDRSGIATIKITAQLLNDFALQMQAESILNESIHRYYAEITYYIKDNHLPTDKADLKIEMKSEILRVRNPTDKSTKKENPLKAAIVDVDDTTNELEPVELKLNVYFDGTRGSKDNVDVRNNPDNYYDERWGHDILKDANVDLDDENSSYNQGYTSITNLWSLDKSDLDKKEIKIYVEGVGSRKYGKDDDISAAAGLEEVEVPIVPPVGPGLVLASIFGPKTTVAVSDAGIRSKASIAMAKTLGYVSNIVSFKDQRVSKVEASTIGFSRGSAVTRHFVSRRDELAVNCGTSESNVVFKFVGLFDTVSSVTDGKNDVDTYDLAIGNRAQKVLHLTAANEHRLFFYLTNIKSSINAGVGYELEIPGCHSDLGGGYKGGEVETIYDDHKLMDRLIEEGWHDKKIVETETVPNTNRIAVPIGRGPFGNPISGVPPYLEKNRVKVSRTISNEYRYIPLSIMIHFAKQYGEIVFNEKQQQENYSVKSPDMIAAKDKIFNFAIANDGAKSISAVDLIQGEERRNLRHRYLHLSEFKESGQSGAINWLANKGAWFGKREIVEG